MRVVVTSTVAATRAAGAFLTTRRTMPVRLPVLSLGAFQQMFFQPLKRWACGGLYSNTAFPSKVRVITYFSLYSVNVQCEVFALTLSF